MQVEEKVSKSEKIRRLFDAGLTVGEISRLMGIRYQFAYNVVSFYVLQKQHEEVQKQDVIGPDTRGSVFVQLGTVG